MTMTSIPRLSGILRKLFFAEANALAREYGVIQRNRVFSGASLLQLLVFGWLKNPQGALKLTVRWDLLAGSLLGPYVQEGCSHETQSPLREQRMPRGSWWIGDLGYFSLVWLGQLVKQGVYFLLGYEEPVTVWNAQG